jgi:hypothetical protein
LARPVALDHLAFEKRFEVTLGHQPVTSESRGDIPSAKRSVSHQELHDLKPRLVQESENAGGLYERNIGSFPIRIRKKISSPIVPLGVAGNVDY